MSLDDAARELAKLTNAKFSASRWSQLESGYRVSDGQPVEQRATDGRLAHMAYVVGLSPEQLEQVGRKEAAEVLRELRRQKRTEARDDAQPIEPPQRIDIEGFFRDPEIPIEIRTRAAERFLRILPHILRGEEPPPESKSDGGDGQRDSA